MPIGHNGLVELPSVDIEVGQDFFYSMPDTMDRDGDHISVRVEAGNPALDQCGSSCMVYNPSKNGIEFLLPTGFDKHISTIYVYLSD